MNRMNIKLRLILCLALTFGTHIFIAQSTPPISDESETFWKKVQWGGGMQLAIGNRFTNIGVSPIAVYPITEKISVGTGLQYNYLSQKDFFDAHMFGASLLTFFSPIQDIQLSLELDQLMVNRTIINPPIKDNFWNTALFIGAGYRTNFAVVGMRYNVLFRERDNIYGQAWMPFVRILF